MGPALARSGYWAPTVTQLLAGYFMLHPDGVFCDIGASSGYFTVLAAEASNGRCRVMAFEPEPHQHACLAENIRRRDLRGATAFASAVGERPGQARLMRHRTNLGDNRIWPGSTGYRDDEWNFEDGLIDVDVVTLDSALGGALPSLVKVDVQGYELHVLRGMRETLSRVDEAFFLVCEWTPKMLRTQGVRPEDVLELLVSYGFSIYAVGPTDSALPVALAEWSGPKGDTAGSVDLICTKGPFEPRAMAWRPAAHNGERLLELLVEELNGHERMASQTVAKLERLGYTVRRPRP
jgi:FkbM family methyltransferase